jgi:hypothetical protein
MLKANSPAKQSTKFAAFLQRTVARLISAISLVCTPAYASQTVADHPAPNGAPRRGWTTSTVTFEQTAVAGDPTLDSAIADAASEAANAWNSVSCTHPQLSVVSLSDSAARTGDGHNAIEWVADFAARGFSSDTGGYADVQYIANTDGVWIISEVDIYLNGQALSCSTTDCVAVRQTMLHEFGHALGLLHPCEEQATSVVPACDQLSDAAADIMSPTLSNATAPSADDQFGLCNLYQLSSVVVCPNGTGTNSAICGPPDSGTSPTGQIGDPCQYDTQCAVGLCSPIAACAPKCEQDSDCGTNQSCQSGLCNGKGLGAPCTATSDCLSRLCLLNAPAGGSQCTRTCSTQAGCPSGYDCQDIDGQPLCAATKPAEGCSCRIAGSRQVSSAWAFLAVTLLINFLRRANLRRPAPAKLSVPSPAMKQH